MKGDIRCVDGRLMRHDPQADDLHLETDCGPCPECADRVDGSSPSLPIQPAGSTRPDKQERKMQIEGLKTGHVLSFEDGILTIKHNGWGTLSFPDRQIEVDEDGFHTAEIAPSELKALRDFLNSRLPK
jgi:hypothetical protein